MCQKVGLSLLTQGCGTFSLVHIVLELMEGERGRTNPGFGVQQTWICTITYFLDDLGYNPIFLGISFLIFKMVMVVVSISNNCRKLSNSTKGLAYSIRSSSGMCLWLIVWVASSYANILILKLFQTNSPHADHVPSDENIKYDSLRDWLQNQVRELRLMLFPSPVVVCAQTPQPTCSYADSGLFSNFSARSSRHFTKTDTFLHGASVRQSLLCQPQVPPGSWDPSLIDYKDFL